MMYANHLNHITPHAIAKNTLWQSCPGGFTRSPQYSSANREPVFVSDSELAAIDARLPAALRFLEQRQLNVSGHHLRALLRLWHTPIHVECIQNEWAGLSKVNRVIINERVVRLDAYGDFYQKECVPHTNDVMFIPTGYGYSFIVAEVSKTWLDMHYPEWHRRFTLACELELDATQAVESMLSRFALAPSGLLPDDLQP